MLKVKDIMLRFGLFFCLMPFFILSKERLVITEKSVLQGAAYTSWRKVLPAQDIFNFHGMHDVAWLHAALGTKVHPETKLINVDIALNDGLGDIHSRMDFVEKETKKRYQFPRWLPLDWFKDARDGDVIVTPVLFDILVLEITCGKQLAQSFEEDISDLSSTHEWADEIPEPHRSCN